eukprot:m.105183 g.105183  ORF g.105183 m.105183 type:complete len:425 (+) comp27627_c0_seq1:167-1441(+)
MANNIFMMKFAHRGKIGKLHTNLFAWLLVCVGVVWLLSEHTHAVDRQSPAAQIDYRHLHPVCQAMRSPKLPAEPPTPLKGIFWTHIPKTGTSFGNTVYRYACPRLPPEAIMVSEAEAVKKAAVDSNIPKSSLMKLLLYEYPPAKWCDNDALIKLMKGGSDTRINGHQGLSKRYAAAGTGIIMFRSPIARFRSAFVYKHANGMSKEKIVQLEKVKTLEEYAKFPDIAGCSTKMLLGSLCASERNITIPNVMMALDLVKRAYKFVGITDYWDVSVCLFHSQFGGTARDDSFRNVRSTKASIKNMTEGEKDGWLGRADKMYNLNEGDNNDDGDRWDPADTIIYQAALRIYVKRLIQFGLQPTPTFFHRIKLKTLKNLCDQHPQITFYCDVNLQRHFEMLFGRAFFRTSFPGGTPPVKPLKQRRKTIQ